MKLLPSASINLASSIRKPSLVIVISHPKQFPHVVSFLQGWILSRQDQEKSLGPTIRGKSRISKSHVLYDLLYFEQAVLIDDLNQMLSTGFVPGLLSPEESKEVLEKMRILDQSREKSLQVNS